MLLSLPQGLPRVTLILGGARSGKSALAEELAERGGAEKLYLATAEGRDGEMAERVALHRARRGTNWRTLEEPMALTEALQREAGPDRVILVDCLTLWLTNLLLAERELAAAEAELCQALEGIAGPVILVSNEVGLGIVPDNALSRRFRDAAGSLNQSVAAVADLVVFTAAGLPLVLKEPNPGR